MTSQLNVDTIKGKTTEGSITIQGEGSATTNLQQGLIKAYVCYSTSSGTAIHGSESFNHSSLNDEGTGQTKFTMTNPMSAAKFSLSDSGGDATSGYSSWVQDDEFSTSTYEFNLGNGSFNSQDGPYHAGQVIGDLA
tara:strand:- start:31 stop:438 length:408 start_codon:yes stop_codon:yes gene_type:complete